MMRKNVIVANYSGGNIVFGKNRDGSIGKQNKWFNTTVKGTLVDKKDRTFIWFNFLQTKVCFIDDLGNGCILMNTIKMQVAALKER
jgi:hypothetical protein